MKRMSLKRLKDLGLKSLNHPLHNPDTDLGDTFYEEEAKKHNYVLYAENVLEPLDNLEPGSLVIITYDGMSARWINGKVYVRKDVLEKKQNSTR